MHRRVSRRSQHDRSCTAFRRAHHHHGMLGKLVSAAQVFITSAFSMLLKWNMLLRHCSFESWTFVIITALHVFEPRVFIFLIFLEQILVKIGYRKLLSI